jgi:uncharacterized protein YegP (UPF0339 family)/outer membrane protein OmpA-like peptidoglycan-associated protein
MAQNETRLEDNYLHCDRYAGHESAGIDGHPQFTKFQDPETELYYFSYLEEDGTVLFRSEGYPTTAARDNGVDSVMRNWDIEERFKVLQMPDGLWYVSLRAGNHQEIARSCGYETEAAASYLTPSGRERQRAELEAAIALAAAQTPTILHAEDFAHESNREEDNYLSCKQYEGHARDAEHPEFAKFQHEDGEHYFVMYDDNGAVVWRSEGYPTTAARDNGMNSVIKNRDIPERVSEKEMLNGYKYFSLKAGNHQEIARSCPKKPGAIVAEAAAAIAAAAPLVDLPEAEVETPAAIDVPEVAIAAAVAAAATTIDVPEVPEKVVFDAPIRETEKEDDYLPCDEYKGKFVNDKVNNVALFKHDNGQYYFVLYNADGTVKLRSEGFKNAKTRDEELSGVLKYHNDATMYTDIERAGHVIKVLKDKSGREVGRSCLEKVGGVAAAPIAAAAAVAAASQVDIPAAPAAPIIEEGGGSGFKWWWLLPLLLLAVLFFLCNKCENKPAEVKPVTKVEEPKPAPVPATKVSVKSFLPVVLYFDNDQPDANTKATTTTTTYEAAYNAYVAMRADFAAKGDGAATTNFFDNDVKKGMDNLAKLAAALKDIVASGEKVNLKIKGFASPLAKPDYNKALTGRRVSSVENYLSSFGGGTLAKAMKDGTIKVSFEEAGEDKASGGTDNVKDKKGSIYGVSASKERRVEIVGVE